MHLELSHNVPYYTHVMHALTQVIEQSKNILSRKTPL
ncbi:hypothetical protein MLPF_2600 [Mycobacterium lepromatosis]|nr:hypothetical protein MLPF_2600 [Mycobacterium lepromatosis]